MSTIKTDTYNTFTYKKDRQRAISFPVGGLGSGSIGIAGNGCLIDWQVYNRPAMGTRNGYSHFAVKAQAGDELLDARVLVSDLAKPYLGQVDERTMLGMPHFRELVFEGKYPMAELSFLDERFPGRVTVRYYNPFIPLNDRDSSIPALFADILVENTTDRPITYTTAGIITNPCQSSFTRNRFREGNGIRGIHFTTEEIDKGDVSYSDFTLAADSEAACQEYWFRGNWRDHVETYWREFASAKPLENRRYENGKKDYKDTGMLCISKETAPGEIQEFHYVLTWNVPNCNNYWSGLDISTSNIHYDVCDRTPWKNYYAVLFEDSWASASYALHNRQRLLGETLTFMDAMYETTIPEEALDAVTANLAILRSPTCLRLEDGSFYGWEGCFDNVGSCEGTCTHVWNYAYALPFLFPALARSIRDLEFRYSQRADGGIEFRLRLPVGSTGKWFHSCADGQLGSIMLTYRDYKISGDREWLASKWESVKKALAYAWSEENPDAWDRGKKGYLDGRQHHTLDMELFGPNAWLQGFYAGALSAAAEMAAVLADREAEEEYRELAAKAKEYLNGELFNGEYFYQKVDVCDRSVVERFQAQDDYWNGEKGQIKYQIADGCGIDQVLAQWHGNLCGLPEIFEQDKARCALDAIFHYNYKPALGEIYNPWRIFAIDEEGGVIMCEWPEGSLKPAIPLTYAQECMDGMQYQAASHMIWEGMLEQGETIVKAVREKYRGDNRNPWCEIECGSYYARSMASYALLLSYSGFTCYLDQGILGFRPRRRCADDSFTSFWSAGSGWGRVRYQSDGSIILEIIRGSLFLKQFVTGTEGNIAKVSCDGKEQKFTREKDRISFTEKVRIEKSLELKAD